jgi:hypothetical protein
VAARSTGCRDSGPQPFLPGERIGVGQTALTFMQTVYATDGDQFVCTAQGTYTRGLLGGMLPLGPSSTGPIIVSAINGTVTNRMPGRNAETSYGITWTATKNP